ncbi:MAG: YSC84-related protein [Pyrinomonadaceae bacterium]
MKVLLQKRVSSALCAVLVLCVFAAAATHAQKRPRRAGSRSMASVPVKDARRSADASRHARDASKVFNELMTTPERGIPNELLDKAEAIAVFPGVIKAGFIVGGRGGQGVISRRLPNGWSAPAFFHIGGADFGAQIGASKTDFVLLFMNDNAVESLLKDKVELGGELSVAAGPYGRTAAASTDARAQAGILSYSRSKGAFIGAVIKGGTINPDNDLNEAVYGMKAVDFLTGTQKMTLATMPSVVRIFPQTLARYSVR